MRSPALLVAALFFSACMNAATAPSPTPQQSVTAETRPTTTPPSPTATTAPLGRAARLVTAAGDFPLLSPDGTTLVSKFQGSKGGPTSALVFQSVDGRTLRRIPDDRASGQMQWLPDSSGVFVELAAGQRAGPLGIISVDGGVLETGLDYANPTLSPDGTWIAAEHQEGCCVGIRIREIWVAPRSGGTPRTLVTSSTPQDVQQPIALLSWDAQGGLLYRDGDGFARVTLDGVRTALVAPRSTRGRVVIASAVSPDNAVILLCAADPLAWWTIANGKMAELPPALRPGWRLREPWCSRPDEVPWYGTHQLILKDVAGTLHTFDALAGGDRPFPLLPRDAVLSASTYILLAAVGQDLWIMHGGGGLPTGLRAPADLLISPIANSAFFVRTGGAAYMVAIPANASRDPSWNTAPDLRVPRPAVADNDVRCGLLAGKLTRPGEGMGATPIEPVTSAAFGVGQGELVGLPDDAPPTGSYVCVQMRPGAPAAGFVRWVRPGDPDYLPQRSALVPTGFLLPQTCAYLGNPAPSQLSDDVVWRIDCGAAPDTRATLAPALTEQSWTLCGSALGVAIWTKGARTLTITEASGNADGRPTLGLRPNSDCP